MWIPFEKRPGVALQSHWNYEGVQDIDAWSNCPAVELLVNGKSMGTITPDASTRRCTWRGINWEPGTVCAIGRDEQGREVCRDEICSAGEPHHLEVTIEPLGSKPNGEAFVLHANASDALIATVRVVDNQGHWCPHATSRPLPHHPRPVIILGGFYKLIKEGSIN